MASDDLQASNGEAELADYRAFVQRQTASLVRDLTRVLFGDFDVVLRPESADPGFGSLAMMTNVAINSARNAINEKEALLDELKAQGAVVRSEKAILEAILETSDDGILYVSKEGRVAYANRLFWGLTGLMEDEHGELELEELIENLGAQGVSPADAFAPVLAAVATGAAEPVHVRFDLDRPAPRSFRAIWRPSESAVGESDGNLLVLRDISQVEEARRAKDQLLGNLAHEVRTPLTTIKGFVDLLARGHLGELEQRQAEALRTVSKNVERLTDLVANMLDADRVRTGVAKPTPSDLESVVREVVGNESPRGEKRGLRVVMRIAPLWVLCDRASLVQITRNLISNAIKYTPSGTVFVRVASGDDGFAELVVEDTGIGIPSAEIDRIFDRFYRAENEFVYAVGGTGVGLSIVKSFVESVGGSIDVESQPGKGSSFRVKLRSADGVSQAG
ncbi:MAG: PAS domain-containing sensor histidine kinase [Planctomycetota bacterium]